MRIGIDLAEKEISAALLEKDTIIKKIDNSIYTSKRDPNHVIMDKIIDLINELINPHVNGIGVSLPSTYDIDKKIIYDVDKIPYWEKIRIKYLIEEKFGKPVGINNDINCYLLGEKFYGYNQDFKNILCIHLGEKIEVGLMVNEKLFTSNKMTFNNINCLSEAYYTNICIYRKKYCKILKELEKMCRDFPQQSFNTPTHKSWKALGCCLGKLISILLINHKVDSIVLGGNLASYYPNYATYIDECLFNIFPPDILLNLVITKTKFENPRPFGAVFCLNELPLPIY